jgi:hypothetical protein
VRHYWSRALVRRARQCATALMTSMMERTATPELERGSSFITLGFTIPSRGPAGAHTLAALFRSWVLSTVQHRPHDPTSNRHNRYREYYNFHVCLLKRSKQATQRPRTREHDGRRVHCRRSALRPLGFRADAHCGCDGRDCDGFEGARTSLVRVLQGRNAGMSFLSHSYAARRMRSVLAFGRASVWRMPAASWAIRSETCPTRRLVSIAC